jgi:hypothetical protein
VAVDAQHDLLQDVLGAFAIRDPPCDEPEKPPVELLPDRLGVELCGPTRFAHRHPHPSLPVSSQQALCFDRADPGFPAKKRARFSGSS